MSCYIVQLSFHSPVVIRQAKNSRQQIMFYMFSILVMLTILRWLSYIKTVSVENVLVTIQLT